MSKIIITNTSSLDDISAMERVLRVMREGRISEGPHGAQYCFIVNFKDCMASASMTSTGTDVFCIYNRKTN